MDQIKLSTNEALVYIAMLNIALGILFGAVPLVLGFIKKERSYGVFGFLGSVIGGALLGVFLSLPIATIFTWLIVRKLNKDKVIKGDKPAGHIIGSAVGAGIGILIIKLMGLGGGIPIGVGAFVGGWIGELIYISIFSSKVQKEEDILDLPNTSDPDKY